jgi:hypothetical protein
VSPQRPNRQRKRETIERLDKWIKKKCAEINNKKLFQDNGSKTLVGLEEMSDSDETSNGSEPAFTTA